MAIDADVTLRRVLYELKVWSDSHGMLNDFLGYGKFLQVAEEGERNYMLMAVNVTSAPSETWFIKYNFEVMILEYVNDEQDNRARAMSDTREIINDLEETIKYSNRWQKFSKIPGDVSCDPAIEVGHDKAFGWVASFQLYVRKRHGICKLESLMPTYDFETDTVVTPACAAGTVKNSDNSYSASVASGGSLTLPDSSFSVNGNAKTANPATTAKAVTIQNEAGNPVAVTDITDTANVYVGEVSIPTVKPIRHYSDVLTSQNTNDDAANRTAGIYDGGMLRSFYRLYVGAFSEGLSAYAHEYRFVGKTGGYIDSAGAFFDVNGVSTTEALAFPDDILYDQLTGWEWVRSRIALDTLVNQLAAAAASTYDGKIDWILPNVKMYQEISDYDKVNASNAVMVNFNTNMWTSSPYAGNPTAQGWHFDLLGRNIVSNFTLSRYGALARKYK